MVDINYIRKTANRFFSSNWSAGDDGTPVFSTNPSEQQFRSRFEYLALPVSVKYYTSRNKAFFVNAGAFAGVLLNQKNTLETENADLPFPADFKTIDYGVMPGIGYDFYINDFHSLSLKLRNNLGLNNINNQGENSFYESTRTNALNFIDTWNFFFKSQYDEEF